MFIIQKGNIMQRSKGFSTASNTVFCVPPTPCNSFSNCVRGIYFSASSETRIERFVEWWHRDESIVTQNCTSTQNISMWFNRVMEQKHHHSNNFPFLSNLLLVHNISLARNDSQRFLKSFATHTL